MMNMGYNHSFTSEEGEKEKGLEFYSRSKNGKTSFFLKPFPHTVFKFKSYERQPLRHIRILIEYKRINFKCLELSTPAEKVFWQDSHLSVVLLP